MFWRALFGGGSSPQLAAGEGEGGVEQARHGHKWALGRQNFYTLIALCSVTGPYV